MSESNDRLKHRKLPCLPNETTSTDEDHSLEEAEDPCIEESDNQTTRNRCADSTMHCFQYCFDAVTSLFQNEDDMHFRFIEGKACILDESYVEDPPIIVILDHSVSSNCSSKPGFFANNGESSLSSRIQGKAKAVSEDFTSKIVDHQEIVTRSNTCKKEGVKDEHIHNLNIQSEGVLPILDVDSKSIVAIHTKGKSIVQEPEMSLTKKKSSILNHFPKMEIIPEDKQFYSYPLSLSDDISESENIEIDNVEMLNEEKLDDSSGALKQILSFHVTFDEGGWEETLTIETEDNVVDMLSRMHEPTANLWLATLGDIDGLQLALRDGVLQQEMDHLSRNALHLAVLSGSARAVRLLLEAGMDPNATDGMGDTPLFYALLKKPSHKIATILFDFGANIPSRQSPTDIGLFLELVIMSRPTPREELLMRLLLSHGALLEDPEAPGGRQPLHYAAMSNNDDLIRTLAGLGADLNVVNNRGMTPMEVAVFYSCKEAQFCLEDIGISNILSDKRSTLT